MRQLVSRWWEEICIEAGLVVTLEKCDTFPSKSSQACEVSLTGIHFLCCQACPGSVPWYCRRGQRLRNGGRSNDSKTNSTTWIGSAEFDRSKYMNPVQIEDKHSSLCPASSGTRIAVESSTCRSALHLRSRIFRTRQRSVFSCLHIISSASPSHPND